MGKTIHQPESANDGGGLQVDDDVVAEVRVSRHVGATEGGVAAPAQPGAQSYHALEKR